MRIGVAAGQHAHPQRRPGEDAEAVLAAQRNQLVLDSAVEQVVGRLLGREADVALQFARHHRFHHAPGGVGRAADVAHLAGPDQVVERAQRLVDGDAEVGPVGLVQVDVIRLEPAQRGVAGVQDACSGQPLRVRIAAGHMDRPGETGLLVELAGVDLRRDDDLVAAAGFLQHAADDPFGLAVAVDVAQVDQVHAGVEGAFDDPACLVLGRHVAEVARAEAERRDLQAGAAEGAVLHRTGSLPTVDPRAAAPDRTPGSARRPRRAETGSRRRSPSSPSGSGRSG